MSKPLRRQVGGSVELCRRKQRLVRVAAAQRSWVVSRQVVLVGGVAAEPAPDAADDLGFVVMLDDEHRAGRAAPAHLAELAGVRVVAEAITSASGEHFGSRRSRMPLSYIAGSQPRCTGDCGI